MATVPAGVRRMCAVCCQHVAQYTCPRCHKAYCSSACYKTHGQQCTESFYREQASSQMKATKADKEQQQQMMQILQRLHEQGQLGDLLEQGGSGSNGNSSDGDEDSSSEEEEESPAALRHSPALRQLIKRVARQGDSFDIDTSDITPELLAELEQLTVQGHLSHLITPWQPWWNTQAAAELQLNARGQRIIAVVVQREQASAGSNTTQAAAAGAPMEESGVPEPPAEALPSLAALAGPRFRPSPLLPWQLLQLLVAYCGVMRLYNGEPDSMDGWEAAEQLLLLAPPLLQLLVTPAPGHKLQQSQQQDAQQLGQHTAAVEPPESLRSACMQVGSSVSNLGDIAGGPAGQRTILQVAMSDSLRILQLGRSAVLLALTDSKRMLDSSAQNVRQCLQSQQQQPKGLGDRTTSAAASELLSKQHLKQLKQHLKLASHKLLFFSVWATEQQGLMFTGLAEQLEKELQERLEYSGAAAQASWPDASPSVVMLGTRQPAKHTVHMSQPAVVTVQPVEHVVQEAQEQQWGEEQQQQHFDGQRQQRQGLPAAADQDVFKAEAANAASCTVSASANEHHVEVCRQERQHQDEQPVLASLASPAATHGATNVSSLYDLD